jgi:hypothetical protein
MLLAFGAFGAVMGWRRGTKSVHRRSLSEPNLPAGLTRRDFERRLRQRRKLQRVGMTALYASIGVVLGAILSALIPR